jgi:hypothetical protein
MAAFVRIAAHLRAVLAAHVAFQFVDRRGLRSPHGVEGDGLMRVTAKAAHFEIDVSGIERITERWRGLRRTAIAEHALVPRFAREAVGFLAGPVKAGLHLVAGGDDFGMRISRLGESCGKFRGVIGDRRLILRIKHLGSRRCSGKRGSGPRNQAGQAFDLRNVEGVLVCRRHGLNVVFLGLVFTSPSASPGRRQKLTGSGGIKPSDNRTPRRAPFI